MLDSHNDSINEIMYNSFKTSIDHYLELKEKIEDYLDNRLSEAERDAFELAMQQDAELAKSVAIVQEINHTISTERQFQEYQKKLTTLGDDYFPVEQNETRTAIRQLPNNQRKWLVAASVLVLIVSSILIWNVLKTESLNTTELFTANYEPYDVSQRGEIENLTDLERKATENYTSKNYDLAIPLLQQLSVINSDNETVTLQLGSAYLSTKQTKNAIATFEKIQTSSINYQAAQWYLALAYLQDNQIEKAKIALKNLANSGERTYPTKARKLLETL